MQDPLVWALTPTVRTQNTPRRSLEHTVHPKHRGTTTAPGAPVNQRRKRERHERCDPSTPRLPAALSEVHTNMER